jgi:TolB-like protein/tetratricopeptide (TPR) repeat protein
VGLGLVGAAVAGGWYLTVGGGESSAEARLGDRSIAVLPFEALGHDETSTLTEGIHGGIQTRLSNVSGLDKVTSRTSGMQFRDSNLPLPVIADSLDVNWVVRGEVLETDETIQVHARLVDAREDRTVWAQEYRRSLTTEDLFDVQSEITKQIAGSLEAELSPDERERVERQPTGDLDAYRLYVKGRARLDTRTEEGMREAVDYFQQAIQQDSTFALAWAGLADVVGLFPSKSYATPEDSLPDHEATARRALELDPDLAEAHASMGYFHRREGNGPKALQHLRRAVEMKPSYAQAHHWLGLLLFDLGRLEAAHEHVSLAVELNPEHAAARAVLAQTLLAQGRVEETAAYLERVEFEEGFGPFWESFVLYHAQRWDELEQLSRERLSKGEEPTGVWRFHLARIAASRGDTAAVREQLAEVRQADAPYNEGFIHAVLGDEDAAFAAWERVEVELWWRSGLNRDLRYFFSDILDRLRDDPRYEALIREINRSWGLNPDGSLPDSVDVPFPSQADG